MTVTIDGTTGVSLVQDDTITDAKLALDANASEIKDALNASGSAPIYACRAWVNFNGTGTVAIRDSGNVSSITDNDTGSYSVNFSTAMPDSNYAAPTAIGGSNGVYDLSSKSTGSCSFFTRSLAGSQQDQSTVDFAVFR